MGKFVDLRTLDRASLLKLRRQIVHLKLKGCGGKEIEAVTGVRSSRVSEIWHRYQERGAEGLMPETPGRKPGEKTLLPPLLERDIRQLLIDSTPDQAGMPYSLWTRQIALDLIRRKYGVKLSLRCMTNYFKRWGFVCLPPAKLESNGGLSDFARFMRDDYPAVVRRAASENVGIYWYSESWVNKEYPHGGKSRPKRVKMAAAVTARGTARFMFFDGGMTQEKFLTLISRLIRYADRKVFFMAEDSKACRGKKVTAWLKGRENRIEVFYYPPLQSGALPPGGQDGDE